MIPSRSLRPAALGGLLAAGLLAAVRPDARGQAGASVLVPVVVTANRLPDPPASVGSDFSVVTGADLASAERESLADAFAGIPGAPVLATGQAGASSSVFLRGANSNQTLFVVDGIRLNDPNVDYGPFLSGYRPFSGDRLEVALGPQSTLYGSGAAGGVVSLTTDRGSGPPGGTLSGEAGSFRSFNGALASEGAGGPWAYNLALSAGQTDNDRLNNRFAGDTVRLRLDWDAAPALTLGATVRGFLSRYGDPSDEYTNDPVAYETEDNWLGTLFLDARPSAAFTSHLVVGGQYRDFDSYDAFDGGPLAATLERDRREVADWQNTFSLPAGNRLVVGGTGENDADANNGFGAVEARQSLVAIFGEDEWRPVRGVSLTGAFRTDDYSTFGRAETGRLTAAWLPTGDILKLRASYGTAFNIPSFLDLYGVDPGFYAGNPNLGPERTRGWDGGIDLSLPGSSVAFSATGYEEDFRDLIEDNFEVFPATTENIDRARSRGLEFALRTGRISGWQASATYGRMEAVDLLDRTALLRRPHYSAGLDLSVLLRAGVTVGGGAAWVGARDDVNALTFETVEDPAYSVARLYAAWQATRHFRLKLRVENALNRRYEPVNGYPALPRGIYGGAEWAF